MHYHLELILPKVENLKETINEILKEFKEGEEESRNAFFDWYVIGGRWASHKQMADLDEARLDQFYQWMKEEKITVSSFRAGKQELNPSSQIEKVDTKWSELFPELSGPCILFNHSNDQYTDNEYYPDVMSLKDVSKNLLSSRVIIAAPDYDGKIKAVYMVSDSIWNGVNFEDTKWSGNVLDAVTQHIEKIESYNEEYKAKSTPKDDWLCVTIDYHN